MMKPNFITYLILLMIFTGCALNETVGAHPDINYLSVKTKFNLSVPEPSGLALDISGESLWTVSDQNGTIYQLDLSGNILQTIEINGIDLEGVAQNGQSGELLVAEENLAEIVRVDVQGHVLNSYQILTTHDNSGLEGICINSSGEVFSVKEKDPGQWISLNSDFSVKEKINLTFAGDYSDITCDTTANRFWILSDQDKKLFLWDRNSGVVDSYSVPVENPEGLAIDFSRNLFYIVSDSENRLYILTREN